MGTGSEGPDHNRVLRDAARQALKPLGLRQIGRSRTWLDDRTWHLIVIEFQPSSWSKGSYLNVGAMWLWHAKDHLSFDYGHRVAPFERADEGAWDERVRALAEQAAGRVRELRAEIADLPAAVRILDRDSDTAGWPRFHAAIAHGLLGDTDQARHLMQQEAAGAERYAWVEKKNARMRQLEALLDDPSAFRNEVIDEIIRSRTAHKLDQLSRSEIEAAMDARSTTGIGDAVRSLLTSIR